MFSVQVGAIHINHFSFVFYSLSNPTTTGAIYSKFLLFFVFLVLVLAYLEMNWLFFHELGTLMPRHSSHHFMAGIPCRSRGSPRSAPGISAAVSSTVNASILSAIVLPRRLDRFPPFTRCCTQRPF